MDECLVVMEYNTYEELIKMIAEFRLEHHDLNEDELDKLVKKTFKINQAIMIKILTTTDWIRPL